MQNRHVTRRSLGRRAALFGLATVTALVVAGGIAYATIPDSGGVFTAGMLNKIGTIRLIDRRWVRAH